MNGSHNKKRIYLIYGGYRGLRRCLCGLSVSVRVCVCVCVGWRVVAYAHHIVAHVQLMVCWLRINIDAIWL